MPASWFEDIVTWALELLADPEAKLLTHPLPHGINRGPSAGYAVMLGLGWDPVEAIAAIRSARPIANVWYAEDALRWLHHRAGASASKRRHDRQRSEQWRSENPLDVVRIIREVRRQEHD